MTGTTWTIIPTWVSIILAEKYSVQIQPFVLKNCGCEICHACSKLKPAYLEGGDTAVDIAPISAL